MSDDHGMVVRDQDGKLKIIQAKNVSTADSLISDTGEIIYILEKVVEELLEPVKVYNLLTNSTSTLDHIIVAQGVLVGDYLWQFEEFKNETQKGIYLDL